MSLNSLPTIEIGADPVEMLQSRLGIDEAQARDLLDIEVACPVPGQDRQSSLGEFMSSEHGVEKATTIVDIAKTAHGRGATPEEAIAQALGFAAVRDKDTGKLSRIPAEAKKKLI